LTLLLRFRSEDLLQCRFAISPLNETTDALRSLSRRGAEAYHLAWQRHARWLVPELGIGPLLAIMSVPGYQPDFLNPAPDGPFTEIDAELGRVRDTPPAKVAAELAQCLGEQRAAGGGGGHRAGRAVLRDHPVLAGDPAEIRDLLADMLRRAWVALIEPSWRRLRDVLDADITYRARRLADAGVAATLDELDPKVSWKEGAVRFAVHGAWEVDVSGTELVLIPSVFCWPGAGVSFDPPAVIYPARGVAGIWQPHPAGDLGRLIGKTRATLLAALAEPASTTRLRPPARPPARASRSAA
jgi:hypothetical protein